MEPESKGVGAEVSDARIHEKWLSQFTPDDQQSLYTIKSHLPRMLYAAIEVACSKNFLRYAFAAFGFRELLRELLATVKDSSLGGHSWAETYTDKISGDQKFTRKARIRGLAYLRAAPSYLNEEFKLKLEEAATESKCINDRLSALGHIRPEEEYIDIKKADIFIIQVLAHIRSLAQIPSAIKYQIHAQFIPYLCNAVGRYISSNPRLARKWPMVDGEPKILYQRHRITNLGWGEFSFTAEFDLPEVLLPDASSGARFPFHVMGRAKLTNANDRFNIAELSNTWPYPPGDLDFTGG